jgi:plasmid stabilization system protein ParE
MPVRFHPAARAELIGARDWYERAQSGLGDAFVSEVERIVALVQEHPNRFPFHADGVRRASLRRFPFSIIFEDVSGIRYIWAVFHHRRDSSTIELRRKP